MVEEKIKELNLDELRKAVEHGASAIRCVTRLGAVGGTGDKVFPPTYIGGVYAVEDRRIDGKVVRCVLLDSVQSQANRMEEALQDAFLPNWRELLTDGEDPKCNLPVIAVYIQNHGWVTSLTAPHRIHDAILRDSNLNGTRFRDSEKGRAIVNARVWDATAFYRYCPTALLFGTWDSTAGEGLDSAKIPRAVVSEIIGVDITTGVRTGSRIDPLGIERDAAVIYRRGEDWTLNENEADRDAKGNAIRFGKGAKSGKPSAINHGNVPPDLGRFGDRREVQNQHLDRLPDILRSDSTSIEAHAVKPGGVTMDHALHTWTLSLTQLRRLRFPVDRRHDEKRNHATRTVLAALALYALALQQERGYWLRSRCELIPAEDFTLDIVGGPNGYALGTAERVHQELFEPACEAATLNWEQRVIRLTPTEQLTELVRRSDQRQPEDTPEIPEETADAGDQG